jgi:transcriptional regulator GlxA family with amidase domain
VRRFRTLVGQSPGSYLTDLRMRQAARFLRDSDHPVGEIATRVGYESEYAFNRAFKRAFGAPPGRYRTIARDAAS